MSYKCDICGDQLPNQQDGTSFSDERIIRSPGYWEHHLKRFLDPVNIELFGFDDDTAALFVKQMIQSRSGYTVCEDCVEMLKIDQQKVADYQLETWYNIAQSPTADAQAKLQSWIIIVGTVFERLSGEWPAWIDPKDKIARDNKRNKKWWQFWI